MANIRCRKGGKEVWKDVRACERNCKRKCKAYFKRSVHNGIYPFDDLDMPVKEVVNVKAKTNHKKSQTPHLPQKVKAR